MYCSKHKDKSEGSALSVANMLFEPLIYHQWHTKDFERGAYNQNQTCLAENFFQVVKKGLHFESVSILSLFRPKIIVISEIKGSHFESVFDFL